MSAMTKLVLGGLGSLAPLFLSFLAIDSKTVFVGLTLAVLLGYAARVVILFVIGALTAYLNKETNRFKAFELGIVAPALISTYIGAANPNNKGTFLEQTGRQRYALQTERTVPYVRNAIFYA
jgi:hypothetical protein